MHGSHPQQMTPTIKKEQEALKLQISHYKKRYLEKAVGPEDTHNFLRYCRETHLLAISHAQHMAAIAPSQLARTLEHMNLMYQDLANKHHQLSNNYHERLGNNQAKSPLLKNVTEICTMCGGHNRKLEVERVRKELFNEIQRGSIDDTSQSEDAEDLRFFQQVNDLLNNQQSNITKHQIDISMYTDVAINAIGSLENIAEAFTRPNLVIPSSSWLSTIKDSMERTMRSGFEDKITAWIRKMFNLFWQKHRKELYGRQVDNETQTDKNTHFEMLDAKRKVMIMRDKLEKAESTLKNKQQEWTACQMAHKQLEIKAQYYREQISKLIADNESLKNQNQVLRLRNTRANDSQFSDEGEDSRDTLGQNIRFTTPSRVAMDKSLPALKKTSKVKHTSRIRQQRTSIDINSSFTERPRRLRQKASDLSNMSLESKKGIDFLKPPSCNEIAEVASSVLSTNKRISTQMLLQSLPVSSKNISSKRIAPERPSHADTRCTDDMNDSIRVVEEVNQQMRKQILKKTANSFSQWALNDKRGSLKKVAIKSNTVHDNHQSKPVSPFSPQSPALPNKDSAIDKILSTIIRHLRNSGYLMKVSEEALKREILKMREISLEGLSNEDLEAFLAHQKLSKKQRLLKARQKRESNEKQINISIYKVDKSLMNNESEASLMQQYLPVFTSEFNALNYEAAMAKNHQGGMHPLSQTQQKQCQQLFFVLESLKDTNPAHYRYLCCFLRYPYQLFCNQFECLNLVTSMHFSNFELCFKKIMNIHQSCPKKEGICQHLRLFSKTMEGKAEPVKIISKESEQ